MVGGESLISNRGDDIMSADSSSGENWLVLSLDFGSGNNIGGSMSLIGGRGRSNIWGGVSISLYVSSSIVSGSVAISSTYVGSSGVGELLRLDSGY